MTEDSFLPQIVKKLAAFRKGLQVERQAHIFYEGRVKELEKRLLEKETQYSGSSSSSSSTIFQQKKDQDEAALRAQEVQQEKTKNEELNRSVTDLKDKCVQQEKQIVDLETALKENNVEELNAALEERDTQIDDLMRFNEELARRCFYYKSKLESVELTLRIFHAMKVVSDEKNLMQPIQLIVRKIPHTAELLFSIMNDAEPSSSSSSSLSSSSSSSSSSAAASADVAMTQSNEEYTQDMNTMSIKPFDIDILVRANDPNNTSVKTDIVRCSRIEITFHGDHSKIMVFQFSTTKERDECADLIKEFILSVGGHDDSSSSSTTEESS
eukprot:TRINITY_DN2279_c0_g1_i1.p1 TRINITY_DN2279_c0_g1~~TRINITY_DN2279_c0_g1_i1.p1  ORF type:complete len:326 (+),score=140.48 TRINITY_DN2279_c0_g1_i1:118-1095(+)